MLSLTQIDKYFHVAQVLLFLGIVGIFIGHIVGRDIIMNISMGIELLVGLVFLVPLLLVEMRTQWRTIQALIQQCKDDVKAAQSKD